MPTTHLALTVHKLRMLYQEVGVNPTRDNLDILSGRILIATTLNEDSDDHASLRELTQVWLDKIALDRTVFKDTTYIHSLGRIIRLLESPGCVEELILLTDNHPLLACILLQAACEVHLNFHNSNRHAVDSIAQRWLGANYNPARMRDPATLCDTLYGSGVWDLFLPDVKHIENLPFHLYRSEQPLLGIISHSTHRLSTPTTPLPDALC